MNQLVALVTFGFLVYGACGSPAERVVGGVAARPNEVPSIAALLRNVPGTSIYNFHCAGALIYPHILLSAAQCFEDMYSRPDSWRVRVGSLNHASGGQLVNVVGIRRHAEYVPTTLLNDVALVNLGGPVNAINTAPVPLPATDAIPTSGGFAYIAGWGAISATATPTTISPLLHVANVVISDIDTCETNLGQIGFVVQDNHFCTTGAGAGICYNDIGSPLYHGGRLQGIASFHMGCGFDFYPAVYTAVGPYLEWIETNVLE